jgi:SAM-dependent MidA family methyltransferase
MPPSPSNRGSAGPPEPSADARAHSVRVCAHIAQSITLADGWISFADYMGAALYAPGLGYYVAGSRKFGAGADFVTAPELTSLFGRTLAAQAAEILAQVPGGELIELGPGTGRLAGDVLAELESCGALPSRYLLLEVSPELRQRQRAHIEQRVPNLMDRVEWIDALPRTWCGAVVANEVLDAIPPHLVARIAGAWFERGVGIDAHGRLALVDRPLGGGPLRDAAEARFPHERDYVSEINPAAQALVTALAQRCESGALLVLDYGFPASEYYHPQRSSGTLMTHFRQHMSADLFLYPGLADLTAHVDFTAIANAGVLGGLTVAGYTTQARFLINAGILDALAQSADVNSAAYLREAAAVQKLLSPAEMGEIFKTMALTRGIDERLAGFREGDQAARL